MGKAKKVTTVSKCVCNVCGQVAKVVPGLEHHYCRGIKLLPGKTLPAMFAQLTHPDPSKRGTWTLCVDPPYTQAEVDAGVAAMEEMLQRAKEVPAPPVEWASK